MTENEVVDRSYYDAAQAQLGERVTNLGRRQTDLENEMRSGFRQIENSFATFTNETRASLAALSQNIAERNKPQWQAIGVAITFAVVIGGMAYWPIRESTSRLEASVSRLIDNTITRQEMDWRQARSAEDRARMEANIVGLRADSVNRSEWTERNRSRDIEVQDISRRVEELREYVGSIYGTRDVIQDLKREVDLLRSRVNQLPIDEAQ